MPIRLDEIDIQEPPKILRLDQIPETNAIRLDQISGSRNIIEAFGEEAGKGIVRGFLNVGQGILGTAELLIPGEPLKPAIERIKLAKGRFPIDTDSAAAWAGRVIGEALPYMGSSLVGGYGGAALVGATGRIIGAGLIGFAVEGENAYQEAKAKGASEGKAQLERLVVGSINAIIEAAQIGRIMKFHTTGKHTLKNFIRLVRSKAYKLMAKTGIGFTADVAKNAIVEAAEEFAQEGVSISVPAIFRGDYPKTKSGRPNVFEIGKRLSEAALGGAVAGGFFAGAGAIIGAAPYAAHPSDIDIDKSIKIIDKANLTVEEKTRLKNRLNSLRVSEITEYYHGSPIAGLSEIHPSTGDYGVGIYFTDSTEVAEHYSRGRKAVGAYVLGETETLPPLGYIYSIKPTLKNPLIITQDNFSSLENAAIEAGFGDDYQGIANWARQQGYDGIINKINNEHVQFTDKPLPVIKEKTPLDKTISKLKQSIDEVEVIRPLEEETISRRRAARFAEFSTILKQIEDPIIAEQVARQALAHQLKLDIEPLLDYRFTRDEILPLYDAVRNSGFIEGKMLDVYAGLNKLFFEGKLPAPHEIDAMGELYGMDLAQSLIQKRRQLPAGKFDVALDILNIPRAILASYDLSAPLRQGLLMLPVAPKAWVKALGQSIRAFTSPKYAQYIAIQLKTNPYYKKALNSGLFESKIGALTEGEEFFTSSIAEKIPGIPASERAYVTFLNSVRFQAFYHFCEQWEGTGKTAADYKSLASFLNHATGRGDIKRLKRFIPILNAFFFSPRLQMARIQTIEDLFTTTSPVRKIVAANLMEFVGSGLLILTLLKMLKGVEVEHNPLSTDFGKIRIGNTRIDFWGGYQPYARFAAQFITGLRKTTETKRIVPIRRGDVIWRFIQTKLSPAAGFTVDIIRGETFLGKKLKPTPEVISREAFERFVPLFIQDCIDATRFQGLTGLGIVSPTALLGVGTMTYPISAISEAAKLKDRLAQKYFGKRWDELGPAAQKALRDYTPHISLMEEKARIEREDFDFMARIGEEEKASAEYIKKRLPIRVQRELDALVVRIPGLSRTINSDWFLNRKRYIEYKRMTAEVLNDILPQIIDSPLYKTATAEIRRAVLQEAINRTKKAVRATLVKRANINDLTIRK